MRLALLLRRAFYAHSKPADVADDDFEADGGKAAMVQLGLSSRLELFEELHAIATNARRGGADEGAVWGGWAELAASGVLRSGVWRDVLLKITTRDLDHVVIGPVAADPAAAPSPFDPGEPRAPMDPPSPRSLSRPFTGEIMQFFRDRHRARP
jgi:hypothetical protein